MTSQWRTKAAFVGAALLWVALAVETSLAPSTGGADIGGGFIALVAWGVTVLALGWCARTSREHAGVDGRTAPISPARRSAFLVAVVALVGWVSVALVVTVVDVSADALRAITLSLLALSSVAAVALWVWTSRSGSG